MPHRATGDSKKVIGHRRWPVPLLRLIQRRVDPLYRRLDLAPVAGAPGAFQYLPHVQQGADQWGTPPPYTLGKGAGRLPRSPLCSTRLRISMPAIRGGRTPLHEAARFGTPATITALLEAGASGSVKDKDGKTPFDVAEHDDEIKRECLVDCVVVCEEVGVLMILATSI